MAITRPGAGRTATCNYCGSGGLRWDKDENGRAFLYHRSTGIRHTCEEYKKAKSGNGSVIVIPPKGLTVPIGASDTDDLEDASGNDDLESVRSELAKVQNEQVARIVDSKIDDVAESFSAIVDQIRRDLTSDIQATNILNASSIRNVEEKLDSLENKLDSLEAHREIVVSLPSGQTRNVGRQHKMFLLLLKLAGLRENILLVGPSAGGKTTAAEKVAEALGLDFFLQPMGPSVTESRLLGWVDASGKLVKTMFRDAYENGGILLADEMDNCNASALTALNAALANGHCGFPDGMIKRHSDFIFIGGANTWGRGADRMYVGRQQLDAATLDRFCNLEWDYDPDFEMELAGTDQAEWVLYVQRIRKIVFEHKLRVLVTPRASIVGASLLRAGLDREVVENLRLWAGMPEDAVKTIRNNL